MKAMTYLGVLMLLPGLTLSAAELTDYSIADLLKPCMEGDNSSRWGASAEAECEQYINGFTDAYLLVSGDKEETLCLPAQNRPDEVRWAFMKWAHNHYDQREQPAGVGLMATLKAGFACSK